MVSGLYRQSMDQFQDIAKTDIGHTRTQLYGNQESTGTCIFSHAMGSTTGPCAFLKVLPVSPGNLPVVPVNHCVRHYIRSATDGAADTNNPLNNSTFIFMGDCFPLQLPTINMKPSAGIIDYGQPTAMPVPNDDPCLSSACLRSASSSSKRMVSWRAASSASQSTSSSSACLRSTSASSSKHMVSWRAASSASCLT
jgi:hypothetical protein